MCTTTENTLKPMNENNRHDLSTPSKPPERMPNVDFEALADRCLELLKQSQDGNHDASCGDCFNCYKQVFVGIAGTPGSGKSFIAEEVAKSISKRNLNGNSEGAECIVIGMDGYHLPRKELKAMSEAGAMVETEDDGGNPIEVTMTYEDLLARRGAPFTYNSAEFIQNLREIKENGEGSMPVYDRDKHDPVLNGITVKRHHKIILVEGLYLLCLHDEHWKALGQLWDDSWYIDVSMKETKRRLVDRHLKYWSEEKTKAWGGDDEEAAARKAEANDMKNARCIQRNSKDKANLIVSNEKILEDDEKNADVEAAE